MAFGVRMPGGEDSPFDGVGKRADAEPWGTGLVKVVDEEEVGESLEVLQSFPELRQDLD